MAAPAHRSFSLLLLTSKVQMTQFLVDTLLISSWREFPGRICKALTNLITKKRTVYVLRLLRLCGTREFPACLDFINNALRELHRHHFIHWDPRLNNIMWDSTSGKWFILQALKSQRFLLTPEVILWISKTFGDIQTSRILTYA